MLELKGIGIRFGGLQALSEISFSVDEGEIVAVIGPNGAGKTTLFNIINRLYEPTEGAVYWRGANITREPAYRLAGLGISRTFQNPQSFIGTTVLESVQIGRHVFSNRHLLQTLFRSSRFRRDESELKDECLNLLRFVGLERFADTASESLAYGDIKRLDFARALASKPRLLLMDEPAAGLNPSETEQFKELILEVARRGITVVLVEHDMKLVMDVADNIVVLNHGKILTRGAPEIIRKDPQVLAAYLGSESLEGSLDAQG